MQQRDIELMPTYKPVEFLTSGLPDYQEFYAMEDRSKGANTELKQHHALMSWGSWDAMYIAYDQRLR